MRGRSNTVHSRSPRAPRPAAHPSHAEFGGDRAGRHTRGTGHPAGGDPRSRGRRRRRTGADPPGRRTALANRLPPAGHGSDLAIVGVGVWGGERRRRRAAALATGRSRGARVDGWRPAPCVGPGAESGWRAWPEHALAPRGSVRPGNAFPPASAVARNPRHGPAPARDDRQLCCDARHISVRGGGQDLSLGRVVPRETCWVGEPFAVSGQPVTAVGSRRSRHRSMVGCRRRA